MIKMSGADILALPMDPKANDAEAVTVADYLVKLLHKVWEHQEGFNGKRPFGNSSWCWELALPLVEARAIPGRIDTDGYAEDVEYADLNEAITRAIDALVK